MILKNSFSMVLLIVVNIQLLNGQNQSKVYDFPVKPGTQEWQNFKSYEDRLYAYNIPEKLLMNMSTQDLVLTCLNYPEFRLIMTRNSLQQGYDYLKTIFNGFGELEKRKDSGMELLKEYLNLNPSEIKNFDTLVKQGKYAFKFTYIEILMAQKTIIENISSGNKAELIKRSISNYETIETMPEYYATFGLLTPGLLLGRVLDVLEYQEFTNKKMNDDNLRMFIDKTLLVDSNTLPEVLTLSKAYLKQLENE